MPILKMNFNFNNYFISHELPAASQLASPRDFSHSSVAFLFRS